MSAGVAPRGTRRIEHKRGCQVQCHRADGATSGRRRMTGGGRVARRLARSSGAACLAAIVAAVRVAAAAPAAPAPLSADDAAVNIDSTYGSGSFGTWHVDAAGLPAFRYLLDQTTDPRARQPELAG